MTPIFENAMRAGAFAATALYGSPMLFTLANSRQLRVGAIFRMRSERIVVGADGVEMVVVSPQLSIQRSSLLACGFPDGEIVSIMKGARFSYEGREYKVENGQNDYTQFFEAYPVLVAEATKPEGYVSKYPPR